MDAYDCVIVGGGPAGLSAALILGRARRRVLVCDAGTPRNAASHAMHGYLSRDGIAPGEFLRIAREQLAPYANVACREVEVVDAEADGSAEGGFTVRLADGVDVRGRTLLLCTGVVDEIPTIDGIDRHYGVSVHHCPYCDGWEHRDARMAVYGCGEGAYKYALGMRQWSTDLVLCTDGFHRLEPEAIADLERAGIGLRTDRVVRLEGSERLERIVFDCGEPLACDALFFCTSQRQRSGLAAKLGARFNPKGAVRTGKAEHTDVRNLWVAGDASQDAQLVIVAAAEGAEAAVAINTELAREDLQALRGAGAVSGSRG